MASARPTVEEDPYDIRRYAGQPWSVLMEKWANDVRVPAEIKLPDVLEQEHIERLRVDTEFFQMFFTKLTVSQDSAGHGVFERQLKQVIEEPGLEFGLNANHLKGLWCGNCVSMLEGHKVRVSTDLFECKMMARSEHLLVFIKLIDKEWRNKLVQLYPDLMLSVIASSHYKGAEETVDYMIKELKYNVNDLSSSGETALDIAVSRGHYGIASFLIREHLVNPTDAAQFDWYTHGFTQLAAELYTLGCPIDMKIFRDEVEKSERQCQLHRHNRGYSYRYPFYRTASNYHELLGEIDHYCAWEEAEAKRPKSLKELAAISLRKSLNGKKEELEAVVDMIPWPKEIVNYFYLRHINPEPYHYG